MGSGWGRQQMSGFGRQALSSSGMAHQGHDCVTGNAMEHFWALQFGWLLFLYYYFGVLQPQKGWLVLLLTVGLSTGLSIDSLLELLHRLPQLLALWHGTQERMTMNVKVCMIWICVTLFSYPLRGHLISPSGQVGLSTFTHWKLLQGDYQLQRVLVTGKQAACCLFSFLHSVFCEAFRLKMC